MKPGGEQLEKIEDLRGRWNRLRGLEAVGQGQAGTGADDFWSAPFLQKKHLGFLWHSSFQ